MKAVFENMEAEVDQNAVDKKCGEIERRNLLIMNENLIAECLSKDVFYTATDSVLNVSRFSDMHDALTIAQKQRFGNKKPVTSSDAPSFDSLFVIGKLNEQIQSRGNTIHELKEKISRLTEKNSDADPTLDLKALVSQNKDLTAKLNALHDLNERFRAENAKVKQHYKELYDSIKITRAKTNDQKNSLLTEIENLKTQLKGKMPCVTIDVKTPKVFVFDSIIDVEPNSSTSRSNRNVHHGYLNSLKDTLDTLREIVEEARSELPSDSNLDYACVYTKRSQELLANASASCPKAVNKRDKFIATTPVTKKKRVTFADPLETSGNNTPKHVKQQSVQPTNVPILPSTGVNTATIASGSKPRSNTKKDKTLPAKSVPKKKVEDHPRNNKSKLSKKNRVDSCTSVRSTVCDTNSNSLCKTCNECINSDSHDKCVDKSLKFSTNPCRKIGRVKTDPQAHHAPVDYNTVCSNQLDPNIDWGSNVSYSPFSSVFKCSNPVDTPMVERTKLDEDLSGITCWTGLNIAVMIGSLWSSKKQTSTSISSIEAEYIAMSGCCAQILWMRSQLSDYGLHTIKSSVICDNQNKWKREWLSCIRSRTEYQLADIFTKALPKERFEFILPRLGMKCLKPETLKRLQDDKDE
ncbi:hypothetical protein Tco_0089912 [Tanacetum coccineum]